MKSVMVIMAAGMALASTVIASPVQIQLNFETSPADFSTTRKGSVIDVLREEKRFSKLLEVIERSSGLRDDLEGEKMVTLFAPTDDAWDYMEDAIRTMRKNRRRMKSRDQVDEESRKGRRGRRADEDEVDADSRKGRRGKRTDESDDVDADSRKGRRGRRADADDVDAESRKGRRGRRDDDEDDDDEDSRRGRRGRGRRGRRNENEERDDDDYDKDIEEILNYHIIKEELRYDDLYEGALLSTQMRESGLNDKRQKIRVFEYFNNFYLNMYARVGRSEIRAENGVVHALDMVLCPPVDAAEQMAMVPFVFSTFITAVDKTDLTEKLEDEKGLTVFAPSNAAWKRLGMENVLYLFSPHGRKDLKRIVEYHMGRELFYSTNLMKDNKIKIDTLLKGESLEVTTFEHGKHKGRGGRRDRDGDFSVERRNDREHHRDEMPGNFIFVVNRGEARVVEHFMDFLCDNAVVHPINSVLIPRDVELPFSFETDMM